MGIRKTMFDDWVTDFWKLLICIAVLALGTLFNVEEPKALAIAVIVQGASNIESFWDFLRDKQIYILLKIMITLIILFSVLAAIFAIFSLVSSKGYFDKSVNDKAIYYIIIEVIAVALPIVPLFIDTILNLKKERMSRLANMDGGEEDEL